MAQICAVLLVFTLTAGAAQPPDGEGLDAPAVQREFRGLWVATVANIDWPSKPGLSTREQKAELIAILDRAVALRLNVIVFQVRPSCDAMYDSKIEPWSEYLTGQMGRAPQPYYDPLAFAVEEAHKRGLELHAWFNPYRVRFRNLKTPVAPNHVTVTHPGLVRAYGSFLWLDPTEPGTRDYSLSVIMDVVRRYDIDGVHIDDHFYPDPEKAGKRELEFPDDASWERYKRTGGRLSRNDWRRENVTMLVQAIYEGIKREKPWVKFGVSPFGIWQPGHPAGILGENAYDKLYGDSRKWLANGWLDYLAPQLYWPIAQKAQSFPALLKWWAEQNTQHRLLVAGMRVNGWPGINDEARELSDEIYLTRRQIGALGEILWHSAPLMTNHAGVADLLRQSVYTEPALVPACTWLGKELPATPVLTARISGRGIKLSWKEESGRVWQWLVREKIGSRWTTEILPGSEAKEFVTQDATGALPEIIAISAVSRYGNVGAPALFNPARFAP